MLLGARSIISTPPLGIYPKIDGYPLSTLQSPGNISNQPALPQETLLFSQRNATNEEFDGTAGSPSRGSREAFLLCLWLWTGAVVAWLWMAGWHMMSIDVILGTLW